MDTSSGGTVSNVFDQSGRLTVANPGADKERTYTYDAVGNLTSVSSPNVAWYNRVFRYDALNRLEHAEGPYGVFDYTYDGVGNRLTKVVNDQTETYTYVAGTNKIQEITGPVAYTYDANGNITGIGSKVLTFNQNNRLVRVEENSNILGEYTYNGEGQRIVKTADGVTTVFHYDFNGNIIAESDETGNFIYEYLYKGGSRLALVDVSSGEIYSFLNDRLGTPQMLANSTNTIVWEGIYKPFGEANVNPNSSVVNNFRFPGQYYDEETGFHYNYHRYYDPQTGRYLTPDPIGLIGGTNLWIYTSNNPMNLIDLLGLKTTGEGITVSFSLFGGTASYTFQFVQDDRGDFGLAISHAAGGAAEVLGGSAMTIESSTNANSINQLSGNSVILAFGAGEKGGYNYEFEMASNYTGRNRLKGVDLGLIPVNIYGVLSNTTVYNFSEMLDNFFNFIFNRESDSESECE